jgi:hypothetical protein
MSITLSQITNENTFGIWKDRTNAIITGLGTVVTLGDTAANNTGNISLTGNVTAGGKLVSNTIDSVNGTLITVDDNVHIKGYLDVNSQSSGTASALNMKNNGTLTWVMTTSADHADLLFKNGLKVLQIDGDGVDASTASLTGANIKIAKGLLPASIDADTTGNAATASQWATGRLVTFAGGDVTGSFTIDGSVAVPDIPLTVDGTDVTIPAGNVTGLSTLLNPYALKAGASFVGTGGVVKVGYNDYIQLGGLAGSGDNSQAPFIGSAGSAGIGDAYVKYGSSIGGSARFMTIGLTPTGSASTTPAGMILELRGKSLSIRNNDVVKISMDGSTGSITAAGDITAFHTFSDRRLKENIVKIENPLDKILQISGYTFNYIGDDKPMTGVIAQEIEEVLPEVVYEAEAIDGTSAKAVRHGNIVGLLIEAIKELKAEVEELKKDK